MYIFKNTISLLILYVTITCLWQNSIAQGFDQNMGLLPYNNASTGIGQTIGGASVAFPDSIPVIFNNPASLAQLRRVTGFVSLNYSRGHLNLESEPDPYYNPNYGDDALNPGIAAFSLPYHLLDLPVTLAGSYNGTISYSYEIGDVYKYSRKSQSASLGLAIELSSRFRIGIGGTHRFGDYTAKTFDGIEGEFESNRTSHYSGNVYHIGLQRDIAERFAFGAVYYFPSKLSIEVKRSYSYLSSEYIYKETQQISGALRVGLGYRFSADGSLGAGYGYQWIHGKNTGLSSISAGIEYKFRINTIILPLYVMYENKSVPANIGENIFASSDEKARCDILGFGGGIQWQVLTLYFAAQWSQCGNHEISVMPAPPWS
jgi:long-subunit fatty acid transport protein